VGNLKVDHIKCGQLPMNLCLINMANLLKCGQLTIWQVVQKRVEIWSTSNFLLNARSKLSICHLGKSFWVEVGYMKG
jgi:hypothetical protein